MLIACEMLFCSRITVVPSAYDPGSTFDDCTCSILPFSMPMTRPQVREPHHVGPRFGTRYGPACRAEWRHYAFLEVAGAVPSSQ
jgi:hypothetical protein